jgi:tetratricopeptide (TPR) repeat protein
MAIGAGLNYSFMQIDYSFGSSTADGNFPPTHRFSLTFYIGKSREEQIKIAEDARIQREKELVARTRAEERQNLIEEKMSKGKEYLTDKRYFDAYYEFKDIIAVEPFNQTANALMDSANNMIQQELEQQREAEIAQATNKLIAEENRSFIKLHFEKGQLLLQNNQYTDALVEFNLALERAPRDSNIVEAIATARRRLEDRVRELESSGREEFQRGNYSTALQILSQALILAPEDPQLQERINALANRIKIQSYMQDALQLYDFEEYDKALSLLEEALKLDPSNARLKQLIERTKRGMGRTIEEEMNLEAERRYLKAVDSFLAGRYEEALRLWKELQKEYPYSKKLRDAINRAEERIKRR